MRTLNVLGAGHVGRTLAALWLGTGTFETVGILNRSIDSGSRAADFIGAGQAVAGIEDLPAADAYLISVNDDAIEPVVQQLTESRDLTGAIVFHASGSLPSSVLTAARTAGASVASVHPVKTFADPAACMTTFSGTYCGYEGDDEALALLLPAFEALGGRTFPIDPAQKTLYHTAIVFGMNYLVALMEVSLSCYESAGVDRDTAAHLLAPITRAGLDNALSLGPARALTGPIARGDAGVVQRQLTDLAERDKDLASLYALLGDRALVLARQAGNAPPERLEQVRAAIEAHKP